MSDLQQWQWLLIAMIFIWSGFVRSGLGFGGAALALPLLLLIKNEPLIFLPIVSIQLMLFSSWIAWQGHKKSQRLLKEGQDVESNIDWVYLRKSLLILIIPKILGVLGLLTLPPHIVTALIFGMISVFAVSYILNKPFKADKPWAEIGLLVLGGYFSGTSLIGAPLIVAVFAGRVKPSQLRDTLFVLWFILVTIKMTSFIVAGVDLQWLHQLWLFPCALIGHLLGMKFHHYIQAQNSAYFFRVIGVALLIICLSGLAVNLIP